MAEYSYLNNETQIQFVNTELDGVLTDILNNTSNLNKISQAFENSSVTLNEITFLPPEVNSKCVTTFDILLLFSFSFHMFHLFIFALWYEKNKHTTFFFYF